MTEVVFHLNVPDLESYACRLLRKAYLKGARVAVRVQAPLAQALDRRLWLMAQGDFIPHAGPGADPLVLRRSPIVLGTTADAASDAQVLVNLTAELPEDPRHFDRVIELVGPSEADLSLARSRWKAYRSAGFEPKAVDLASDTGV